MSYNSLVSTCNGGTKLRFIIRLVSDREGWDLDETFGPYNTEKEAVTACLSYMLNPDEFTHETLYMDLIRGEDEEWMDGNPSINPNREDMTEQLLRDTDTFEKLKTVCKKFHNSFYKDGWDISMEVKRIDEQTSNESSSQEALEFTIVYDENYNCGNPRFGKTFGPSQSEKVVVNEALKFLLFDSNHWNLNIDEKMEEDEMEQEEIDEIKNDILNKTKTYEQLLKVCREYDNSFFGSNISGWNGWGLKLIKR